MKSKILIASFLAAFSGATAADQVGSQPLPVLNGITVTTVAIYDPDALTYNYTYTITNPSANTGKIWDVEFDMKGPPTLFSRATAVPLTMPYGRIGDIDFTTVFNTLPTEEMPHGDQVEPFGERLPEGWRGDISADGYGSFYSTNGTPMILPGQTMGGFTVFSPGLPNIKDMELVPDWVLSDDDHEPAATEEDQAHAALKAATAHVFVLGPSPYLALEENQWNAYRDDINKAIQLGWITDSSFANSVVTKLAAARANFDANGASFVVAQLQDLQQFIHNSTPSQRNDVGYALLQLNIDAMVNGLPPPDTSNPDPQFSPQLSLVLNSPSTLPVGANASFTAHVIDLAHNNTPISGFDVTVSAEGVNENEWEGVTDDQGNFTVTYAGGGVGTDSIVLRLNSEQSADSLNIQWQGGPDLVVSAFIPPYIRWSGSGTIHLTEITKNDGSTAAAASVTSYYVSTSTPFDWNTAEFVGERNVGALAAGQQDSNGGIDLSLPADLGPGTYTMIACADNHQTVVELDEANNCITNQVVAPLDRDGSAPPNPDCTKAAPSVLLLWPPNHKMASITIQGVTDPTNLPLTFTVMGIQQDEPVNARGDGNTAPDGAGIGTPVAQVRSERSGTAPGGRLYFIAFKASNSQGGTCTGGVSVGVPHDQGGHNMPVDNGQRYDSTASQ
jgi:CARDB protein